MSWYADGGRKSGLAVWAAVAVIAYAAMQVTGWFEDAPFLALVAGALAYFAVRGVAVALRELAREPAGETDDDIDYDGR